MQPLFSARGHLGVLQIVVRQLPHRHDLLAHVGAGAAGHAAAGGVAMGVAAGPEPDIEVERLRAEMEKMRIEQAAALAAEREARREAERRERQAQDKALAERMHAQEVLVRSSLQSAVRVAC